MQIKNMGLCKLGVSLLLICMLDDAFPAEISLISGFYRGAKIENSFEKSEISAGARYSDLFEGHLHYFAESTIDIKTYRSKGGRAPKNRLDLRIVGGGRYYLDPFTARMTPYCSGNMALIDESDVSENSGGILTETRRFGLYYGTQIGLRFSLTLEYFMDIEAPLFQSALFAKERVSFGATSIETTKTDLYLDTSGSFENINIALGMIF